MTLHTTYINKLSVAISIATLFFVSCQSNLTEVKNLDYTSNEPIGIAENMNLKYTDSGKITAHLISPKMLDYSNKSFSYSEFPEGVILDLYDGNQKTRVTSNYAIIYNATNVIDLQGNVVVATHSKDTLNTDQLFYDTKKEWVFTNHPVRFRTGRDLINGIGFDADSKFKTAQVLEINGLITLNEE